MRYEHDLETRVATYRYRLDGAHYRWLSLLTSTANGPSEARQVLEGQYGLGRVTEVEDAGELDGGDGRGQ
jgi:hypothetical protein